MGVETEEETIGEAPVEMYCQECSTNFWTDETMINDCPNCGHVSMELAD